MDAATLETLTQRAKDGLNRKQVVAGKDRLLSLSRRKNVGLVWATTDLSRNSLGKLKVHCRKFEIPLLVAGESEDLGEVTGLVNTKVYLFKKSFSGLRHLLNLYAEWLCEL